MTFVELLDDPQIKWKVTGDEAVLGEVDPEVRLRRVDGKWLYVAPRDKDAPADYEKRREELFAFLDGILKAVNSGEITTGEQLGARFWSTPRNPPTSQEATEQK